jgi:hypothetical protein
MTARRTGPSQRTAAQRAAIDRRAAAYPRPLSLTQRIALVALKERGEFIRSAAGWHPDGESVVFKFSTQTMESLRARRMVKRAARRGCVIFVITAAGRDALRRSA